uniref:Trimethylguanosine synthase n=1 Tax=Chromera velia CCMP2878 TaxID=1169474 RepID=A0A0G4GFG3_9ALVE|eukprot:Cvel_4631.t1-p1 / transcript=Cvel_4631.t1 / gene=Cvel_4631 / organism=Chromera_velia_CCMP2878 / gene_product=Trimethylguanosine synthase, putative / transcript_product=Trimethylguanosine synthase, putative / location=Cvel_scaffold204:35638-43969(-) / protein_length=1681 / sequence_SO=supercontig / SO=protein_coding / is_pseudo=false
MIQTSPNTLAADEASRLYLSRLYYRVIFGIEYCRRKTRNRRIKKLQEMPETVSFSFDRSPVSVVKHIQSSVLFEFFTNERRTMLQDDLEEVEARAQRNLRACAGKRCKEVAELHAKVRRIKSSCCVCVITSAVVPSDEVVQDFPTTLPSPTPPNDPLSLSTDPHDLTAPVVSAVSALRPTEPVIMRNHTRGPSGRLAGEAPLHMRPAPSKKEVEGHYYSQRYKMWSKFDKGVAMDTAAWYEATPEAMARHIAEKLACDGVIVDGCCGVGGNTVHFAETCALAIGVDNDARRVAMARQNAKVYGVSDRVKLVKADYMQWVDGLLKGGSGEGGGYTVFAEQVLTEAGQDDAQALDGLRASEHICVLDLTDVHGVFVSPPWGGPVYKMNQWYSVKDPLCPDIVEVFQASCRLCPNGTVCFYLPRNMTLQEACAMGASMGYGLVEVEKMMVPSAFTGRVHPVYSQRLTCLYFSSDLNSSLVRAFLKPQTSVSQRAHRQLARLARREKKRGRMNFGGVGGGTTKGQRYYSAEAHERNYRRLVEKQGLAGPHLYPQAQEVFGMGFAGGGETFEEAAFEAAQVASAMPGLFGPTVFPAVPFLESKGVQRAEAAEISFSSSMPFSSQQPAAPLAPQAEAASSSQFAVTQSGEKEEGQLIHQEAPSLPKGAAEEAGDHSDDNMDVDEEEEVTSSLPVPDSGPPPEEGEEKGKEKGKGKDAAGSSGRETRKGLSAAAAEFVPSSWQGFSANAPVFTPTPPAVVGGDSSGLAALDHEEANAAEEGRENVGGEVGDAEEGGEVSGGVAGHEEEGVAAETVGMAWGGGGEWGEYGDQMMHQFWMMMQQQQQQQQVEHGDDGTAGVMDPSSSFPFPFPFSPFESSSSVLGGQVDPSGSLVSPEEMYQFFQSVAAGGGVSWGDMNGIQEARVGSVMGEEEEEEEGGEAEAEIEAEVKRVARRLLVGLEFRSAGLFLNEERFLLHDEDAKSSTILRPFVELAQRAATRQWNDEEEEEEEEGEEKAKRREGESGPSKKSKEKGKEKNKQDQGTKMTWKPKPPKPESQTDPKPKIVSSKEPSQEAPSSSSSVPVSKAQHQTETDNPTSACDGVPVVFEEQEEESERERKEQREKSGGPEKRAKPLAERVGGEDREGKEISMQEEDRDRESEKDDDSDWCLVESPNFPLATEIPADGNKPSSSSSSSSSSSCAVPVDEQKQTQTQTQTDKRSPDVPPSPSHAPNKSSADGLSPSLQNADGTGKPQQENEKSESEKGGVTELDVGGGGERQRQEERKSTEKSSGEMKEKEIADCSAASSSSSAAFPAVQIEEKREKNVDTMKESREAKEEEKEKDKELLPHENVSRSSLVAEMITEDRELLFRTRQLLFWNLAFEICSTLKEDVKIQLEPLLFLLDNLGIRAVMELMELTDETEELGGLPRDDNPSLRRSRGGVFFYHFKQRYPELYRKLNSVKRKSLRERQRLEEEERARRGEEGLQKGKGKGGKGKGEKNETWENQKGSAGRNFPSQGGAAGRGGGRGRGGRGEGRGGRGGKGERGRGGDFWERRGEGDRWETGGEMPSGERERERERGGRQGRGRGRDKGRGNGGGWKTMIAKQSEERDSSWVPSSAQTKGTEGGGVERGFGFGSGSGGSPDRRVKQGEQAGSGEKRASPQQRAPRPPQGNIRGQILKHLGKAIEEME